MRARKWLKRAGIALAVVAVSLGLIEAVLALTDPLGIHYFNEQNALFFRDTAQPDARGYGVEPGTYEGRKWSFTILPDGTRSLPDTAADAPRTAVFIGDSLTFGYGVDDAASWVNLVAAEFPDWHFVNAALPAFNMVNYARTLPVYPDADVIFVVTIANDRTAPTYIAPFATTPPIRPFTQLYWQVLTGQFSVVPLTAEETESRDAEWRAALRTLAADPRVQIVTFPDSYADAVREIAPEAATVAYFTQRISWTDPHADAAGNRELFESMLPVVRETLESR